MTSYIPYHFGASGVFSSMGADACWSPSAELVGYSKSIETFPKMWSLMGLVVWSSSGELACWPGIFLWSPSWISHLVGPPQCFLEEIPFPALPCCSRRHFSFSAGGRLTDAQKNMQDPSSPQLDCSQNGQAQTLARASAVDTMLQASAIEMVPIFGPLFPVNAAEVTTCLLRGGEHGQAWWKRTPSPLKLLQHLCVKSTRTKLLEVTPVL